MDFTLTLKVMPIMANNPSCKKATNFQMVCCWLFIFLLGVARISFFNTPQIAQSWGFRELSKDLKSSQNCIYKKPHLQLHQDPSHSNVLILPSDCVHVLMEYR